MYLTNPRHAMTKLLERRKTLVVVGFDHSGLAFPAKRSLSRDRCLVASSRHLSRCAVAALTSSSQIEHTGVPGKYRVELIF